MQWMRGQICLFDSLLRFCPLCGWCLLPSLCCAGVSLCAVCRPVGLNGRLLHVRSNQHAHTHNTTKHRQHVRLHTCVLCCPCFLAWLRGARPLSVDKGRPVPLTFRRSATTTATSRNRDTQRMKRTLQAAMDPWRAFSSPSLACLPPVSMCPCCCCCGRRAHAAEAPPRSSPQKQPTSTTSVDYKRTSTNGGHGQIGAKGGTARRGGQSAAPARQACIWPHLSRCTIHCVHSF